jgi:hypothetical protein
MVMPEDAPVLFSAYTAADLEQLFRRANVALAGELAEAKRRRVLAEAWAKDDRERYRYLQRRLERSEADRVRLLREQRSRLLPWVAAGSAAGLAGGALMLLARWAGW